MISREDFEKEVDCILVESVIGGWCWTGSHSEYEENFSKDTAIRLLLDLYDKMVKEEKRGEIK